MTRYNCTKEGMGGGFKCVYYGSIYTKGGTCSKSGDCEHKEIDPRDKLHSIGESQEERG